MAKKITMPFSSAGILTTGADVKSGGIEVTPMQVVAATVILVIVVKLAHVLM